MYKFISLFVISTGVEVGVTLGEEHSVRMFENIRLRKIFAPEWEEVMGGWKKLHNDERLSIHPIIHPWLYSSLLDFDRFFSFLILYRVGRTPWTGDQPVESPLPTHRGTQIR
jgi:hypothetical protein